MPLLDVVIGLQRSLHRMARFRRWIVRGVQLLIFLAAGLFAFLLRFDFSLSERYRLHLLTALAAWALAKVLTFHLLRLDHGWWRYASVPDLVRLGVGNVAGSALGCLLLLLVAPAGFPRSLYLLDFLLCSIMTAGVRLGVRLVSELSHQSNGHARKRTLIYGAGDAGVTLLREIHQDSSLAYEIVGFIDDSAAKAGGLVQRVKVLGNGRALTAVVRAQNVELVLIALPSATGVEMTAILHRCQEAGVPFKTVPGLAEVMDTNGIASQLRDVAVEDLLGRNPIQLDESGIRAKVEGKVVVVTGAAGSIGSELCRQIARFRPAAIVAYDCAESALFFIDREMRENFPAVPFHPEIGDVRNTQRLAEVFERYHPAILYHAAAYKHVPMMEAHPFEAIENNVVGTWNVAVAAAQHGIADFVMISTDKAVRPTNVMGATKRVAELVINGLQNGGTNYVSVRFGNVLGSNGSVIPVFKQQIAARKPLTVTHPDMRRYFMTIPEAAQLVLQASSMGKGGEIFVLDMGEQVKIVDLARNLILLSGLRPDEDIKIDFTGIRPGEKLYEELAHLDEETRPTTHAKIKVFAANGHSDRSLLVRLDQLRHFCATRDLPGLVLQLKDLVPDYNPSADLLRRVITPPAAPGVATLIPQPEAQLRFMSTYGMSFVGSMLPTIRL
jgi:FlaA1/EpsC-like NDP-sugar epimerase